MSYVILANARIQDATTLLGCPPAEVEHRVAGVALWIPAFAGMTDYVVVDLNLPIR
jgi:hypothetical protein